MRKNNNIRKFTFISALLLYFPISAFAQENVIHNAGGKGLSIQVAGSSSSIEGRWVSSDRTVTRLGISYYGYQRKGKIHYVDGGQEDYSKTYTYYTPALFIARRYYSSFTGNLFFMDWLASVNMTVRDSEYTNGLQNSLDTFYNASVGFFVGAEYFFTPTLSIEGKTGVSVFFRDETSEETYSPDYPLGYNSTEKSDYYGIGTVTSSLNINFYW